MAILQNLLATDFLGTPVPYWLGFIAIVITVLALDLGVLHQKDHAVGARESLLLSAAYIAVGLAFGAGLWLIRGPQAGVEYLTGFVIEKSLAMDNVFVIAMVFSFFAIPRELQHRVLFWGIVGVILLRAALIATGAALIAEFSWILYVFGAFLIATGVRMLYKLDEEFRIEDSPLLRFLRRHLRVTPGLHGNRFLVRLPATEAAGAPVVWWVTPLFLALFVIETVDLVFAVDSVPAIFAITQDPFIVYTSNIFAILGLRALYFALAALVHRFRYLKVSLAAVLVFVGGKIIAAEWVGKIPAWFSLSMTAALLAAGVLYSLYRTRIPHGARS
ncbi:MAG: hypothetical protein RLZZ200_2639 [Pseudomonadota bacterium]|jgi:tellurite resistance protein TerC